jgi:hypothetical protein
MVPVGFRGPVAAILVSTVLCGAAMAESAGVHLSIGLKSVETPELPTTHVLDTKVELGLHVLPTFLRKEPRSARDPLEAILRSPSVEPEWRRIRMVDRERVSLRLDVLPVTPVQLATVDEITRQIESLDMVGLTNVVPILEPVRVLSGLIVTQANQLLARGMSVELGDRVDTRYTPLKGLAGDIQRGQYLRSDDVTGRQFNFDLRLVLAWRPNGTVRIEAGYAVAYLSGDTRTDFGQTGPLADRSTNYLIHGPCAALNLDF